LQPTPSRLTFAPTFTELTDGVMVTQQILVLLFRVRVLVGQLKASAFAGAFLLNSIVRKIRYFWLITIKIMPMQTITIDIINQQAIRLLEDLELLQLIHIRREEGQTTAVNWEKQYKGAMTKQSLAEIDSQLLELRNEWE
jgi:hypothetical protein